MSAYRFRENDPIRNIPARKFKRYKSYKKCLKNDFNNRCGYCDSLDEWRSEYYEIDHFVPKFIMKEIEENDYQNLVYSCRSCNNNKKKHWFGDDEKITTNGSEGFIDPCEPTYSELFYRNKDGVICCIPSNNQSFWIYDKLKLYKREHALIWKLSRINSQIKEIEKYETISDDLLDIKSNLLSMFYKFVNQLNSLK